MTCRELVDFLLEYLAGELPAGQHATFERHLGECPDCVAYLHGYREAVRLGKASLGNADGPPPADVPEELVQAVLAAVRRTGR
jgi:anti-sigma factor RsiW